MTGRRRWDFWRAYAAVYDRCWDSALTRDLASEIWRQADPSLPFIEIGAGTGLITAQIRQHGGRYVMVSDPCAAMLDRLRRRLPEAPATQGGAAETPTTGGDHNVIVANVLHLVSPGEAAAILRQAGRLAGPGGRLIATAPLPQLGLAGLIRGFRRAGDGWWHVIVFCLAHVLIAPLATASRQTVRPIALGTALRADSIVVVHDVQQVGWTGQSMTGSPGHLAPVKRASISLGHP